MVKQVIKSNVGESSEELVKKPQEEENVETITMYLSAAAKKQKSKHDDLDPVKHAARQKIAEMDKIIQVRKAIQEE